MKKLHKKIIAYFLVVVLNASLTAVSASSQDYDRFLGPTGSTTMYNLNGIRWLQSFQAERLVSNLIDGNYAFVANSDRAWVNNKVVVMEKKTVMNSDRTFMIPSGFAREYFGVASSEEYISAENIIGIKGFESFSDPRGFLLMGEPDCVYVNNLPGSGCEYYIDYYTVSDAIGKITWQDKKMTEAERLAYINKWQEMLTYPKDMKSSAGAFITKSVSNAESVEALLSFGEDGAGPFSDLTLKGIDTEGSTYKSNLMEAYTRLETMAIGYFVDGKTDVILRDNILSCIEYLHKWYFSKPYNIQKTSSSWTTYEFSIPYAFGNVLALMYGDISKDNMKRYTDTIFDHVPDPTIRAGSKQYGAEYSVNRAWKSFAFFNTAVLADDTLRMNYAMKYSNQIFEWNLSRQCEDLSLPYNGFYKDGAMISHDNVAYNAGYGTSYIDLVSEMKILTDGTVFDIDNIFGYENLYDFIKNNYLPFLANGIEMKMVTGRHNVYSDSAILAPIINLITVMPREKKQELTNILISEYGKSGLESKSVSTKSRFMNYLYKAKIFSEFLDYTDTIEYEEVDINTDRVYYCMDRAIHRRDGFTAALAMSSSRTEKYECLNGSENTNAWYTGDGMLCVYADDTSQYTSIYFANVNPYYIPGTTVDSTERTVINTATNKNWGLPDNDWAGGASDGENSSSGMILGNRYVSGLEGKKSFFMIDDRIVCIGSGISGGNGTVYTVVDNKLIDSLSKVYVNGEELGDSTGTLFRDTTANQIWFNNMGYVPLDNSEIEIVKEQRNSRYFIRMSVLHGENPSDESYAYIMFPNKTLEETENCYRNSGIQLAENSKNAHIVKDLRTGTVFANLFSSGKAINGFSFSEACSVIINSASGEIHVADPTQKLNNIVITLPEGCTAVGNDKITVNGNKVTVDLKGTEKGASYKIEYYGLE